jgi:hypothetical protein
LTEVEYDYIDTKVVGNNSVVFKLEDGTQVVVTVDIARAGKRKKPDGTDDYHFEFRNNVKVKPANKKFKVKLPIPNPNKNGGKGYTR